MTQDNQTRQPKWTEEETGILFETFRQWGPYRDGDYSQFFRMVHKALPHRTFAGALRKVHDGQVEQKLPYFGLLPVTEAKNRDAVRTAEIADSLNAWLQKREADKKRLKTSGTDGATSPDILTALNVQNGLLAMLLQEVAHVRNNTAYLEDIRKFAAGTYRRLSGDNGKFAMVEIMQHAADVSGPLTAVSAADNIRLLHDTIHKQDEEYREYENTPNYGEHPDSNPDTFGDETEDQKPSN